MPRLPVEIAPELKAVERRRVGPGTLWLLSFFLIAIAHSSRYLSRREKTLRSVLANPKDVRFDDACKIARWLHFTSESGQGSHMAFARAGEKELLNFQNRDGKIPPYQARQLAEMINRYWDFDTDRPL